MGAALRMHQAWSLSRARPPCFEAGGLILFNTLVLALNDRRKNCILGPGSEYDVWQGVSWPNLSVHLNIFEFSFDVHYMWLCRNADNILPQRYIKEPPAFCNTGQSASTTLRGVNQALQRASYHVDRMSLLPCTYRSLQQYLLSLCLPALSCLAGSARTLLIIAVCRCPMLWAQAEMSIF